MESNYRQAFKSAIARIYHSNGRVLGAGFLVSDRHLLTCAHVVTEALGIPQNTIEMPSGEVDCDFPLISPGQKMKAKVKVWQPVEIGFTTSHQQGEDIAGLELESLPVKARSVRLVATPEFWGHPFQIFGFPGQRDMGVWASGVLRDQLANGWIQLEDIKAQGYSVQPGFSGAPIWDEQLEGVVGMAVAAEKKREDVKAAFMIPTSILKSILESGSSGFKQWIDRSQKLMPSSDSLSPFVKVKLKAKRSHLAVLWKKYEAAYNQLSFTLSQVDVISIQEQIAAIEREIAPLEQEIQNLADG